MIKIEKNIEHERENKSIDIEEKILTESIAYVQTICASFSHSKAKSRAPCSFFPHGFPRYMLCICVNVQ